MLSVSQSLSFVVCGLLLLRYYRHESSCLPLLLHSVIAKIASRYDCAFYILRQRKRRHGLFGEMRACGGVKRNTWRWAGGGLGHPCRRLGPSAVRSEGTWVTAIAAPRRQLETIRARRGEARDLNPNTPRFWTPDPDFWAGTGQWIPRQAQGRIGTTQPSFSLPQFRSFSKQFIELNCNKNMQPRKKRAKYTSRAW